jgi:DNA-binding response OmpR family regulator
MKKRCRVKKNGCALCCILIFSLSLQRIIITKSNMNTFTAEAAVMTPGTVLTDMPAWVWAIIAVATIVAVAAWVMLHNTKRKAEKSMENLRSDMERRHREEMDLLMKSMVSQMESAIAKRGEAAQPQAAPAAPQEASGTQPAKPVVSGPTHPTVASSETRITANTNPPAPQVDIQPEEDLPQIVDDYNAAEVTAQFDDQNMEVRTGGHRFTMLMVDDNADMCRFVHDYFRGVYHVFTASNGVKALEVLAQQDNIDLVVSDVTMPQMDGMELCRRIKTDLRWSHIPVILLTGLNDQRKEMEGLKLGADDYITKPFNAEKLRLRVKSLIEKKERRQQQFREQVDVEAKDITITSVDEVFIQNAMRICEEHIADTEFSVEALGHELNLSRTYLYKKLINITGKSPNEFIRTIRMKRGKQMLEKDTMQIAEISAALGYSSPKRFTENFKLEYGKSPSEYLREVRSQK